MCEGWEREGNFNSERGKQHEDDREEVPPRKCSDTALLRELKEREWRKKNICVRSSSARTNMESAMMKVEEMAEIEWDSMIIRSWEMSGEMSRLRIKDLRDKVEVMRKKGKMRGSDVWIDDDLTLRELKVQKWLRREAERATGEGRHAKVAYMKIERGGVWWRWNEREG